MLLAEVEHERNCAVLARGRSESVSASRNRAVWRRDQGTTTLCPGGFQSIIGSHVLASSEVAAAHCCEQTAMPTHLTTDEQYFVLRSLHMFLQMASLFATATPKPTEIAKLKEQVKHLQTTKCVAHQRHASAMEQKHALTQENKVSDVAFDHQNSPTAFTSQELNEKMARSIWVEYTNKSGKKKSHFTDRALVETGVCRQILGCRVCSHHCTNSWHSGKWWCCI